MNKNLFKLLAVKEIDFFNKKRVGSEDFKLLFFFLIILFTLSLLIISTNRGLLESLMDTFLAKNSDNSISMLASTDYDNSRPISQIVLKDFKKKTNLDADIFIEGDNNKLDLTGFLETKNRYFFGKFLLTDSLTWKNYAKGYDSKLNSIILNKTTFKKYFNYKEYADSIYKEMKIKAPSNMFDLKSLWLNIYFNRQNQFIQFNIIWVDNIYDVVDIDFLLPMDVIVKKQYISEMQGLNSVKEDKRMNTLIYTLNLSLYKNTKEFQRIELLNKKVLKKIAKYFEGKVNNDTIFEFEDYINKSRIDYFLKYNGFDRNTSKYEVLEDREFDKLEIVNHEVCVTVDKIKFSGIDISKINNKKELKIIENNESYTIKTALSNIVFPTYLIAYVKNKDEIDISRKLIENYSFQDENNTFFRINTLYKNSLAKLGFLTKVLSELKTPYLYIFSFIFLFLIFNQIVTIISHRKSQYAILIAKGVERVTILKILMTQLMTLLVVSAFLSFLFIKYIIAEYLNDNIRKAIDLYKETIDTSNLNILPVSLGDLLFVGVLVSIWVSIIVYMYLYKINVLKKEGHIGDLLKG